MKKTSRKQFDCVEMMHKGALRIYAQTKGMTVAEELAYWRKRTEQLLAEERASGHAVMLVRETPPPYRTSK